ncbi:zinc cluster transcription factor [Salix suchowensis]|nr:zinc cluster transcription factor [Salix suchowensis]
MYISRTDVLADRDSARWGLSPKMVQRRRILFWDLFVADSWTLDRSHCLGIFLPEPQHGRPPSFSLAYIDCEFPDYKDGLGESGGDINTSSECVADVASRTLTAEAPSYATIMELDKKVRDFSLPPLPVSSSGDQRESFAAEFTRCVLDHTRETSTSILSRLAELPLTIPSFFNNPQIRQRAVPHMASCQCVLLEHVDLRILSSGPRSPLASSAMAELEQACILFSKAAQYSNRARKALHFRLDHLTDDQPILTRLSEKARLALAALNAKKRLLLMALPGPNGTKIQGNLSTPTTHILYSFILRSRVTLISLGIIHRPSTSTPAFGRTTTVNANPATLGYTPETVRPMLEPWAPERRHSDVYSHATASVPIARSRLGTTQFQNLSVDQYPPQETRSVFMESPSDRTRGQTLLTSSILRPPARIIIRGNTQVLIRINMGILLHQRSTELTFILPIPSLPPLALPLATLGLTHVGAHSCKILVY